MGMVIIRMLGTGSRNSVAMSRRGTLCRTTSSSKLPNCRMKITKVKTSSPSREWEKISFRM
jgi:hypothetical protein